MKMFKTLGVLSALALSAFAPEVMTGASLYAHVPFAFVAAGYEFPAGDYQVQRDDNGMVYIHGTGKSVITLSIPAGVASVDAVPNLRFTRVGQKEYLAGVQNEEVISTIPLYLTDERKLTMSH